MGKWSRGKENELGFYVGTPGICILDKISSFSVGKLSGFKTLLANALGGHGLPDVPFSMSSILSHTGISQILDSRAHHLCSSGALLVPRSPLPRFHLSFCARKLSSSIKAQSKLPLPVRSPRALLAQHPDLLLFRNTTVMLGLRWEAGRGLAVKVHL